LKVRLTYDHIGDLKAIMVSFRALPGRTPHWGEKDLAVQALEKAFAEREPWPG